MILAIETSCDETSAAVVSGFEILSNIVSSQIELHAKWGGIVPEAAARAHVEAVIPVIEEAIGAAGISLAEVSAIAVTNRPGLVAALSVGVTAAKALAFALAKPLIGVHHLEGHILSPLAEFEVPFPHLCLIVSGGHTEIVHVRDLGDYEIVGQTLDDAAGEAFDKSARLLGLGYPGGPAIQRAAKTGNQNRYDLPSGLKGKTSDFSFSGLKTAVLRLVEHEGDNLSIADAAACVQDTVANVLCTRTIQAAEELGLTTVSVVGGVAANQRLRQLLSAEGGRRGFTVLAPSPELCTDNAAMIGLAASWRLTAGQCDDFNLDVLPNSPL